MPGPRDGGALKAIEGVAAGHERLREAGIAIVAVSTDSEQQQTDFAKKHELPFLLLSDERRTAVAVLGIETVAAGENVNVASPIALAVDREGVIRAVIDPVDPDAIVDQAMRALSEPIPAATEDAAPST